MGIVLTNMQKALGSDCLNQSWGSMSVNPALRMEVRRIRRSRSSLAIYIKFMVLMVYMRPCLKKERKIRSQPRLRSDP